MNKIYLAGSLFKESDIKQRIEEAKKLREKGYEVYNPIEAPCNDKVKLPSPSSIFDTDYTEMIKADIFVVCLDDIISGNDMGVACEIGLAHGLGMKIIGVMSDIRFPDSNQYKVPPVSINHFVLGLLEINEAKVYSSFQLLIDDIDNLTGNKK